MYVLTDVYDNKVICNNEYKDLEEAKADLHAEFCCFTSDDNTIEYGEHCFEADNEMSAWARLKGKYRVWNIIEVLPWKMSFFGRLEGIKLKNNYYVVTFENGKTVFVSALNKEDVIILAQAVMIKNGMRKIVKNIEQTTNISDMVDTDFIA